MLRAIQIAAALLGAALFHSPAHAQADPFPGVTFIPITAEQAREVKRELRNRVLYVDVRSPIAATTPPDVIDAQVPFAEMPVSFENDFNAALLSRGLYFTDPVIVIGSDGRHALQVSERLAEIGYSRILVVTDGFDPQPGARTARANR
jgi:rhodanese-related sulfurtransferase